MIKKNRKQVFLNNLVVFITLAGFICLSIMLVPAKSRAQKRLAEIEKNELLLEEQRIKIEEDRKALNRDCGKVPPSDTAKRQDCQKRQNDIMVRMQQYKKDLDALEKLKASGEKSKDVPFPPAAANLVNIMDKVTKDLNRPKGGYHKNLDPKLVCNLFFQGIGEELKKQGLPAGTKAWQKGLRAHQIKEAIESDKTGEWREVKEKDVQQLANKGIIVVGLSKEHVATAFPAPPGAKIKTNGPLFRDGNEHAPDRQADHRLHASSWGAIPSHNMFQYEYKDKEKKQLESPKFYVWTPSESLDSNSSDYKTQIAPRTRGGDKRR